MAAHCLAQGYPGQGGHWKVEVVAEGYTSLTGSSNGTSYTWPYARVGSWGETEDGPTELDQFLPINVFNNSWCRLNGSGSHKITMTWVDSQGRPTTVGCPETVSLRLWSVAEYSWYKEYPISYSAGYPMGDATGTGDNGMGDPFNIVTTTDPAYHVIGSSYGGHILRRKPQNGVLTFTVSQSYNGYVSNMGEMGRFYAGANAGVGLESRDVAIAPAIGVTYHAEEAPAPSAVTWDGVTLSRFDRVANPLPRADETGRADIGLGTVANAAVILPEQYKIKYTYVPQRTGPAPTQEAQHLYAWSTSYNTNTGAGTYRGSQGGQPVIGPLSGSLIDSSVPSAFDIPNMFVTYTHPNVMNWGALVGFVDSDGNAGQTDEVSLDYTWRDDSTKANAKLQVKLHKDIEDKHLYKTLEDTSSSLEVFRTTPQWTPPASTLPTGHLTIEGTIYEAPLWNSVFVDELKATLATAALAVPAGKLVTAMKLLGIALPLVAPKEEKAYVALPSASDFAAAQSGGRVGPDCTDITDSEWQASRKTWYDTDLYRVLAYGPQGYIGMQRMGHERQERREWLYSFRDWSRPGGGVSNV